MLNLRESPERERESRERDVIIGLDLAAAAGVDKACAIRLSIIIEQYDICPN